MDDVDDEAMSGGSKRQWSCTYK